MLALHYPPAAAKSLQLCMTLCDPTNGNPPGSTIPGILQAGTLEWVAIVIARAGANIVVKKKGATCEQKIRLQCLQLLLGLRDRL